MRAGWYSFCRSGIFLLSGAVLWTASTGNAEDAANPSDSLQPHSTIEGRVLYRKLCAECHGLAGVPPEEVSVLTNPPRSLTTLRRRPTESSEEMDRRLMRVIREGIGENMLPFRDRLTEEQIRSVAHYVGSLTPSQGLPQAGDAPSQSAPAPQKPSQPEE